ncbi:hypothetical protein P9112_009905 [Eukaryota sp. TZLM1-RC]
MPGETLKRDALAPSASYSPGFISFTQQLEKHFLRLNPNRQLLRNPFKHFNKRTLPLFTLASDGLSLRLTFSTASEKTMNRRSAREFETAIASGQNDIPTKSRKRNSRVQQQVRPRQRQRTDELTTPMSLLQLIQFELVILNLKYEIETHSFNK